MKKISLLLLLISIFSAISVPYVFAASDVLRGLGSTASDGQTTKNYGASTDGQDGTASVISPGAVVTYSLSEPTDITSMRIYMIVGKDIKITLKTSSGAVLYSFDYQDGKQDYTVNVKKVERIVVTSTGTANQNLGTLSAFGVPSINYDADKFVIDDLKSIPTSGTSVNLSWTPINSAYLKHYKIYSDLTLLGSISTSSFSVSQLVAGKSYNFKVVPVDVFDDEYTGSSIPYTVPIPDTTPPAVPVNVKVTPDRYTASVTADPVPDPDLAGYHLYLDGIKVTSQPVQLPFTVSGLKLDTEYQVEISSIDTSGNISERSQKATFKTLTLETEPAAVSVTGMPFNGGALLSWSPVSLAKDYKVYNADGSLIMKTTQTSAKITRLKNGQVHSFYVIASNDIGDSPRSNVVEVKPESSLAPDVALSYKLKDVAEGTSSWFNSFWLLLAFTISIPLSFYVSNRVKGLFES